MARNIVCSLEVPIHSQFSDLCPGSEKMPLVLQVTVSEWLGYSIFYPYRGMETKHFPRKSGTNIATNSIFSRESGQVSQRVHTT